MSDYNMPRVGLFGRRCLIANGMSARPFVYRIVNSGVESNTWSEPPLTYQSENNPVIHDHFEEILIVVCDTLISEDSKLVRVARKDVKLMPYEEPERKTGHWVYDENGMDWDLPAWVCSECHGRNGMIPTYIRGKDKMIKVEHPLRWAGSKYCPNCGADMRGEHGETD